MIPDLLPPWLIHPDIPGGSIGWRMGRGEGVHDAFYRWFSGLSDEAARSYETENPEPADWHGFYRNIRQHPWV